jgi:hypothetical protein
MGQARKEAETLGLVKEWYTIEGKFPNVKQAKRGES